MDTLPVPHPRSLTAFCTAAANGEPVSQVIAELALRGPVTILDGGNCCPAHRIARLLALRAPCLADAEAGRRIFLQRAFTCYGMLSLLENTPALPQPHILLNPFASFYDEQVPLSEIHHLFARCLRQIERLRQPAPLLAVLVPGPDEERSFLLEQVCQAAESVYVTETPTAAVVQPALF